MCCFELFDCETTRNTLKVPCASKEYNYDCGLLGTGNNGGLINYYFMLN